MSITQLFAAVAAGLLLYLLVRTVHERFAVWVTVAGGLLIAFYICTRLSGVFSFAQHLAEQAGVQTGYFSIALKALAICYLGEFIAGACKDCGQSGWGDRVELACRCSLIVLSVPLFEDFLELLTGLLK